MDVNIDLSLYENTKVGQPHRVKTYALFKPLTDFSRKNDVVCNVNEITVTLNGGTDCKNISFDKVFYNDYTQTDLQDSISKSLVYDVNMGFSCYLIMCCLPTVTTTTSLESRKPNLKNDTISTLTSNVLKMLLSTVKNEETLDSSLHVSYFKVLGNKVIDFLKGNEYKDLKIFEVSDQENCIQIPDLTEKPLVNENDIDELLTNSFSSQDCFSSCYPSILSATLVQKNINSEGFECIKIGKINVVNFEEYRSTISLQETLKSCSTASSRHTYDENWELFPSFSSCLSQFLKPAFGGNAKTTVLMSFSSVLDSLVSDLNALQWVSRVQKIVNYPSVNEKMIIPNSLKDYSEEIHELKKIYSATCEGSGVMIENLKYRCFKNRLAVEDEKLKAYKKHFQSLVESINIKKQNLMSLQQDLKFTESEIQEEEMVSANIKFDLQKLKSDNSISKVLLSGKVEEILAIKAKKKTCEVVIQKLRSDLAKVEKSSCESMISLQSLKENMMCLSQDMAMKRLHLKDKLLLLMTELKAILSDFNMIQKDVSMKLNSLSKFDALFKTWQYNTKDMLSKFSHFINDHDRNFNAIELKISSVLLPLERFQNNVLDIIQNKKSEEWITLSHYLNKVQTFSDSSLKTLTVMMYHLNEIHSRHKSEVMEMNATMCCLGEGFKQFVSDLSLALTLSKQHFEAQNVELAQLANLLSFNQEFKKNFDDSISKIKNSIATLKQMCTSHVRDSLMKWSEIKRGCYADVDMIKQNSLMIHKEMLKYCNSINQLHSNVFDHSTLKERTEIVENMANQLLQMHAETKLDVNYALEEIKNATYKERLEVINYIDSQKLEVAKDFRVCTLNIESTSQSFKDELRNLQHMFSSNNENLAVKMDVLLSSIGHLVYIYNNCVSTSVNVIGKFREGLKIVPEISCLYASDVSTLLDISMDEKKFVTSTPIPVEKKNLDLSFEREKLLSYIKAVFEEQTSQKCVHSDSDSEGKKDNNVSTRSLPDLSSHTSNSLIRSGLQKNLKKLKFCKK